MPLQFKVKCNAALLFIFTVLQLGHNGPSRFFKVLFLNVELPFDFSNNYEKISDVKDFFDRFIDFHDLISTFEIPFFRNHDESFRPIVLARYTDYG